MTPPTLTTSLPPHCHPSTAFLTQFSSLFHTCAPTPLAFTSTLFGCLSIVAWLFAQLPQIYKNYTIKSTSGLSIYFLVVWFFGDLSNLLGAIFTHQADWQITIGAYYVFVDLCLVVQWFWYEKLRRGRTVLRVWRTGNRGEGGDEDGVVIEGVSVRGDSPEQNGTSTQQKKPSSRPRPIFRVPTFQPSSPNKEKPSPSPSSSSKSSTTPVLRRAGPSSPLPSPSPRTILLIATLIALTHASPIHPLSPPPIPSPSPLETLGTLLSWTSTFLYLSSRLPQLLKNFRRKSTSGLSPHLFLAAFCGNLFYSAALLTNPSAWTDFPAYGGGGWAGPEGSVRGTWVGAALPFFLGAAGVLALDGAMGAQFVVYGDGKRDLLIAVEEEPDALQVRRLAEELGGGSAHRKSQWRRVSGWMRGWIPSISEPSASGAKVSMDPERAGLLGVSETERGAAATPEEEEHRYGTL